jgi:hypothetical protein
LVVKYFEILKDDEGRMEAVKLGWNWAAFFLTFIWAFAIRHYTSAAIVLLGAIPLVLLEHEGVFFWLPVCGLVMGSSAGKIKRRILVKRGYTHWTMIPAGSRTAALSIAVHSR